MACPRLTCGLVLLLFGLAACCSRSCCWRCRSAATLARKASSRSVAACAGEDGGGAGVALRCGDAALVAGVAIVV